MSSANSEQVRVRDTERASAGPQSRFMAFWKRYFRLARTKCLQWKWPPLAVSSSGAGNHDDVSSVAI